MRGPGRAGQRAGRHISISATDAEWETVRRHARRRGLSMSRYLVGLAERGGAEEIAGPAVALTRGEQRELLAALRALRALVEAGPSGEPKPEDAAPEGGDGAADGPTAETVAEMTAAGSLVAPVRDYEDRTGGIALDAEGYDELIRRLRALEGRPGLPEKWEAGSRRWLEQDARWRRDRDRVARFLAAAEGFVRARPDLEDALLTAHGLPPGPGLVGWRAEGRALAAEAEGIAGDIGERELAAHERASGGEPGAVGALAARIAGMLGPGAGSAPTEGPR